MRTKLFNFGMMIILAVLVLALPKFALAHTLETNNNVGAVMHVDPNDDPRAGEEAKFYFEFKDTNDSFDITKCECEASINIKDQEIFKTLLNNKSEFVYAFPEKGIYLISVSGTPNDNSQLFKPFDLVYDMNVREGKEATSSSGILNQELPKENSNTTQEPKPENHTLHTVLISLAIFIIFLLYFKDKYYQNADK